MANIVLRWESASPRDRISFNHQWSHDLILTTQKGNKTLWIFMYGRRRNLKEWRLLYKLRYGKMLVGRVFQYNIISHGINLFLLWQ